MPYMFAEADKVCGEMITAEYDALMQDGTDHARRLDAVRDARHIGPRLQAITALTGFLLSTTAKLMEHPEASGPFPAEVEYRRLEADDLLWAVVHMAYDSERGERDTNIFQQYCRKHGLDASSVDFTSRNRVKSFSGPVLRDIAWVGGGVARLCAAEPGIQEDPNTVMRASTSLHRIGRVDARLLTSATTTMGSPYIATRWLDPVRHRSGVRVGLTPKAADMLPASQRGCPVMRALLPGTGETIFEHEWNRLADVLVPPHATAELVYTPPEAR